MTEAGGPATQAGIRYQDQVTALYLGRMIDPRERPRHDQPVEIRVEAPTDVDDLIVRFADGSRTFFQIKLSLEATGPNWATLWSSFQRQLNTDFALEDRLELVLGESSTLASQLREITARHHGSDLAEWQRRLTQSQRRLVSSIKELLAGDIHEVWRIVTRLDISFWQPDTLVRDLVPLWMPTTTVSPTSLFGTLAGLASEAATVRARIDGTTLYERLRTDENIIILDPQNWGSAQYRDAIASLCVIEVPGTEFSQRAEAAYIWPKCRQYDRERRPDFDDDLPGWRNISTQENVDLCNFPSINLDAVVVVAGPGFGKTTLVHAIAQKVASAGLLPAIVPITKLSESDLTIVEYLSTRINKEFDLRIDWRAAANAGLLVLLLDGLDEVSSDRRTLILERLKVYRASSPSVRWLLTVRDATALAPPEDAMMVELSPLGNEDIPLYVDFYRPGEPNVSQVLLDRISARPDLAHLARIPIFLALMLVMRQENQNLRRSDLLDTYVETLFRPAAFKDTQIDTIDTAALRRIAQCAAFSALETDTMGVGSKQLERCVRDIAPTLRTDDIREALIRRGVLRREGLARLTFPFPIVQEYLASIELLEHHREQIAQRLVNIVRRPWAQAIQFALERHPTPGLLIDGILEHEDDVFHTALRLLGRCVANGMSTSDIQRQAIGKRFAAIWGGGSWRTNELVKSIIVDAFSQPLHPAVRSRLGERHLTHDGAGTIVARLRDTRLSLEVLDQLLDGDIEYMLNLGDMQTEVNRLGTIAFDRYINRSRAAPRKIANEQTISSLIGHMATGCVDVDTAFVAAQDETLSVEVRLAAWSLSMRELDAATEDLIVQAAAEGKYSCIASAAQALACPPVDIPSIMRLLESPRVPSAHVLEVLECLVGNWARMGRAERIDELLAVGGLSEEIRIRASLFAVNSGNPGILNSLIDEIPQMSAEMVAATVSLLGHVPERSSVERAVSGLASREWSAADRLSISGSLAIGLTYRLKMGGLRTGVLEFIPPHPGRTVPYGLLQEWMTRNDHGPRERLRITLDAVQLGVPAAANDLRPAFDAAMAAPIAEGLADGALAGRALEVLHANGEAPPLDELERLARSTTYNLASSVVRVIARGGGKTEVEILMRLYEEVPLAMLRSVIIGVLEPLAGRLGLRITRSGRKLMAMEI